MSSLKIAVLLLINTSLLAMDPAQTTNNQADNKFSTTQKIAIVGAVGVGVVVLGVVSGPFLVPTIAVAKTGATLVTVKATAAAVTIKSATASAIPVIKAAGPIIGQVKTATFGAYTAKKYFFPSEEEKLNQLRREEALEKPFKGQVKEAFKRDHA